MPEDPPVFTSSLADYWKTLTSAALRGVQEGAAPLPSAPSSLSSLVNRGPMAQRILDGIAVTWPLVVKFAPTIARPGEPVPPLNQRDSERLVEIDAFWAEILHDPAARYWPEKKLALVEEMLLYSAQTKDQHPIPPWHLPDLFEIALPNRRLSALLRDQLTKDQRMLITVREEWESLIPQETELPSPRQLEALVKDQFAPLDLRRKALDSLLRDPWGKFPQTLARLAQRCFTAGDVAFAVQPLPLAWHRDWLPPGLLPALPIGIAPRDKYLARAYSLLGMVPPPRWFPARTTRPRYQEHFTEKLLGSTHPEALIYAFAHAIKFANPSEWIPQLTELYRVPIASKIMDEVGVLPRLGDYDKTRPGYAENWLIEQILQERVLTAHSPLLEVLVHLGSVEKKLFERTVRAILTGLQENASESDTLTLILNRLALRSQVEHDPRHIDTLNAFADCSPVTAEAWREAKSLLSFRRRIHNAYAKVSRSKDAGDYPGS